MIDWLICASLAVVFTYLPPPHLSLKPWLCATELFLSLIKPRKLRKCSSQRQRLFEVLSLSRSLAGLRWVDRAEVCPSAFAVNFDVVAEKVAAHLPKSIEMPFPDFIV